jgi:hypothetical protein
MGVATIVGRAGIDVAVGVAVGVASSAEPQASTVKRPTAIPTARSRLDRFPDNISTPSIF